VGTIAPWAEEAAEEAAAWDATTSLAWAMIPTEAVGVDATTSLEVTVVVAAGRAMIPMEEVVAMTPMEEVVEVKTTTGLLAEAWEVISRQATWEVISLLAEDCSGV
jgi:hypothetical protein